MPIRAMTQEEIKTAEGESLLNQYGKLLTAGDHSAERRNEVFRIREELQSRLRLVEELAYSVRNGYATAALEPFPHLGINKPNR